MHIAIITAGGAGMFCGSCMLDNAWAGALQDAGAEISLIPLYTPIRVDSEDRSTSPVFYGGINLYLEGKLSWWRSLPRVLTRWLDQPWIIRRATKGAVSRAANELGSMAAGMLAGEAGPHGRAGRELAEYIRVLKPDVVIFSNALLSGALATLKQSYAGPVYCMLQGDDVFLDGLTPPWQAEVTRLISVLAQQFDGFFAHSVYYRDEMSARLSLPAARFQLLPLAIDTLLQPGLPRLAPANPPTVGFFARICREKGFHVFLEAAAIAAQRHPDWSFLAGGWLGGEHRAFYDLTLKEHGSTLGERFRYAGSPETHAEKTTLLLKMDVLSVPAVYREPKGLYVLEAQANGIPTVQPQHGAFPELMATARGGVTVTAGSAEALVAGWEEVLESPNRYAQLSELGYQTVRATHSLGALAKRTLELLSAALP